MKNKEEKRKKKWVKPVLIVGTVTALVTTTILTIKKKNSLKEENDRLKGENLNLKDQCNGFVRTIEKLSYNLGKNRKYD